MFRAVLLLIIRRINCLQTAIGIPMRYADWLLFIQSWSSWWWAASLFETCGGLLLNKLIGNKASCWFALYRYCIQFMFSLLWW